MNAAWFDRTGDLAALRVIETDTPRPGPDEVLVQVHAAGINPSDVKNVQGFMSHTTLPRIPGRDFAGTVVAGPDELIGQEVWGSGGDLGFTRDGTHAEFVCLPRNAVATKPTSLSMEEAAAVGVPYVTAWSALAETGQLTAADTVAIIGAAGSVGRAAVQIARWKGAAVLGVIRKPEQAAEITALSAQPVMNAAPETLCEAIQAAAGGQGVSLILDTVGGMLFEPSLRALAPTGRLVAIASSPPRVEFSLLDFYRRELTLRGVNTLILDATAGARLLGKLAPGFEAGQLQPPPIAAHFPLSQAPAAYAAVQQGQGKTLLIP